MNLSSCSLCYVYNNDAFPSSLLKHILQTLPVSAFTGIVGFRDSKICLAAPLVQSSRLKFISIFLLQQVYEL
jgi:hypothetical protein